MAGRSSSSARSRCSTATTRPACNGEFRPRSTRCCRGWSGPWLGATSCAKVDASYSPTPRMPTNSYDAIILGDDLAALTCAALCARRGLRTLWLPHDDRPARYPVGPHKLPVEPLLWPARGGKGGERVLKELGLDLAIKR